VPEANRAATMFPTSGCRSANSKPGPPGSSTPRTGANISA
jgi:hypothetical protein